jgi:3-hydroxyacyl-CoA dehydrogenase/enoyl-CoA hydratase/carnithine racemase
VTQPSSSIAHAGEPAPPEAVAGAGSGALGVDPLALPPGLPTEQDAHVAVVTVRDVPLPDGAGTLALVTLASARERRPVTLGPRGLLALHGVLVDVQRRAAAGELAAVAVTGQAGGFVAGADLEIARGIRDLADGLALGRVGHATLRLLGEMAVPTVAWVGGHALGGGLELALHCDHRVAAAGVRALGLPEASLGIVPGWGGCWLLPRLVGTEAAIELAVLRPLAGNRLTSAEEAARLGLVDAVLPAQDTAGAEAAGAGAAGSEAAGPEAAGSETAGSKAADSEAAESKEAGSEPAWSPATGFEAAALAWTAALVREGRPSRAGVPEPAPAAVDRAAAALEARLHGAAPAYAHVLDLIARAGSRDREAGFAAEDEALAALLLSDEAAAALYTAELTGAAARASRPGRVSSASQPGSTSQPSDTSQPNSTSGAGATARPVREVGVVGAGLMAAQLGVLLAGRLDVPVHLREVDEERAAAGRDRVQTLVEQQVRRGRLDEASAARLLDRVRVGTDLADLAGADLVIEAVTEVLDVKRAVLAEVEALVDPGTVLATNTSALSVTAMAAGLVHPERVVGLHFFNPVAQMPLVEVVSTAQSSPAALATAVDVAGRAGKTVVRTTDRPGFVVNRVLLRLLAEVLGAVQDGTPVVTADRALRPLGLPMSPFALLDLVGLPVARHVLETLHDGLGPRFRTSPGLDRLVAEGRRVAAPGPDGVPEVDPRIQDAFTAEAGAATSDGARGSSSATTAPDAATVLERVSAALAEEVGALLDEGVVAGPEQVDLAMVLGAGWPAHLGGICPYLDRSGWSERVLGRRLLPQVGARGRAPAGTA